MGVFLTTCLLSLHVFCFTQCCKIRHFILLWSHMKSSFSTFLSITSLFFLISCGNPVKILQKEINKAGYIQYNSPIEAAGTGTLIGGPPSHMMYIAHPDTCFSNQPNLTVPLRRYDKVVLPTIAKRIETSAKVNFDLIEVLGAGSNQIGVGVEFDRIQTISLEFHDVTIEYMDAIALKQYYDNFMSEDCKIYLNQVGFIIQALKVGKMKFRFTDKHGADLELSAPVVEQLLNLGVDVGYSIENEYTLVIETPMYMGFQLGQLRSSDEGAVLYRAAKVKKNNYQFESISVFDDTEDTKITKRSLKSFSLASYLLADQQSLDIADEVKIDNYASYK